MSSTLPPSDPPFSSPSDPAAEVLEQGYGGRLPSERDAGPGSGLRRGLIIAGGVIGATAIGVGAWAAYSFLATGPQPAEALPAATLAYASIDLDPSGGQKVEALQTLNKFPAFEDEVGIGTDDDLLKSIVEKFLEEAPCEGLSFADDFEPWLGERAAVAAVDLGDEDPELVVVLQVKDAAAADDGLSAIKQCGSDTAAGAFPAASGSSEEGDGGWAIGGDWAVISETEEIAQDVVDAAAEGSLADDEDFQHWTDEAGGDGVVTLYAAPAAGDYLADHVEDLFGFPFPMGSGMECTMEAVPEGEESEETCTETSSSAYESAPDLNDDDEVLPDEMLQMFRDFEGAAAIVRFDNSAIELESAGDAELMGSLLGSGSGTGGEAISTLPADTGAAFGAGFREGWFMDLMEWSGPGLMGSGDIDEVIADMEEETGLELPEDAETLLGQSAVLAVGSDVDPDAFFGSEDGSDVPVALKVKGDPEEIEKVLEKLRTSAGSSDDFKILESDSQADVIVIGPNADYREHILADGKLGDDRVFRDVMREAAIADTVFFVNVNELEDLIAEGMEGDDDFLDNLKPVSGFGGSAWVSGDVAHGVLRITTD